MIDLGRADEARRLLDEVLPRAKAADAADPRLAHTRALIGDLAQAGPEGGPGADPGQRRRADDQRPARPDRAEHRGASTRPRPNG